MNADKCLFRQHKTICRAQNDSFWPNKQMGVAKMEAPTALNAEEESALCSYIEYMANRGFPLSIQPVIVYCTWTGQTQRI